MTPILNWGRIISVSVFSVSFILGMALAALYQIGEVTHDTPLATTIAIIVTGQSVAVVSTGLAAVVEGGYYIMVIAHQMVQRGVERGRAAGREEGRAEGRAEGREEGISEGIVLGEDKGRNEAYEDAAKQNEAYYKRMREALDAGEDFDELPPTFGRNGR